MKVSNSDCYLDSFSTSFKNKQELAGRVVMPNAAHRVRQMIDNLYDHGKNAVYQNPNSREDCIGVRN